MGDFCAIIVAAGRGSRMNSDMPKQYRHIGDICVLTHSIACFLHHPDVSDVICVIHPDDKALYQDAIATFSSDKLRPCVHGGATRGQSVIKGLNAATRDYVLIHDGARPFLDQASLSDLIAAIRQNGAAFLGLPVVDSLWRQGDNDLLSPVSRDQLWRAQTPQGFKRAVLQKAYETAPDDLGDDVAVARHAGLSPTPILGNAKNYKITHEQDLLRAKKMLRGSMNIRIGTGFDVHAFGDGEHVILNGIKIAHDRALMGHSDADVAMHAITDAFYGAIGAGDIGQHFPPSDAQWKDADSALFLRHACDLARAKDYVISNIDCTIICEHPKINPHSGAMCENLAKICAIDLDRINVKATTSEGLGFTGRGEGIAAQAAVSLVQI